MDTLDLKKDELTNKKRKLKDYAYYQIGYNVIMFEIRHVVNMLLIYFFPELNLLYLINLFYFLNITLYDYDKITSGKLIRNLRYGKRKKKINGVKVEIFELNNEIFDLKYQKTIEEAKNNPIPIYRYDEISKSIENNSKKNGFQKDLKK